MPSGGTPKCTCTNAYLEFESVPIIEVPDTCNKVQGCTADLREAEY